MTSPYRSLTPNLHSTADAAIAWFVKNWGVSKNQIQIEAAFDHDVSFRPTFFAPLTDGHILCVEVSEGIYNNTLDSVVLDCRNKGLPVKLFVAVPKDVADPQFGTKMKSAKRAGVGIIEADPMSGQILQPPLSLSLTGVRPIEIADFPTKYRHALQHAHQTFLGGEPAKACSLIYDELERGCRTFASKCEKKGLWQNSRNWNLDSHPWLSLMQELDRTLDRRDANARKFSAALCARIEGVTSHRNESSHRPKNMRELMRRDKALRTRFESAVDLLTEFLTATKGFRL